MNVNVQCRQRTHKPYTPTHARALRHVSLREHDDFERGRLRTLALGREGDADLGEEPLHPPQLEMPGSLGTGGPSPRGWGR